MKLFGHGGVDPPVVTFTAVNVRKHATQCASCPPALTPELPNAITDQDEPGSVRGEARAKHHRIHRSLYGSSSNGLTARAREAPFGLRVPARRARPGTARTRA